MSTAEKKGGKGEGQRRREGKKERASETDRREERQRKKDREMVGGKRVLERTRRNESD